MSTFLSTIANSLKIVNCKLKIAVFGMLFLLFIILLPKTAQAGLMLHRPFYLGLSSGLVGYWSFDGKDMAGVTAFDRSGNANNGTLTNSPRRVAGRVGQALNFDGTDDYVVIPHSASLNLTNKITISAWIKPSQFGVFNQIVSKALTANLADRSFYMRLQNGFPRFGTFTGATDTSLSTPSPLPSAGQWYHLAGVYDGATLKIYVDGVEKNSVARTGSVNSNTGSVYIGALVNGAEHFAGLIDDVRIYNRALTQDEIKRLYNLAR